MHVLLTAVVKPARGKGIEIGQSVFAEYDGTLCSRKYWKKGSPKIGIIYQIINKESNECVVKINQKIIKIKD